MQGLGFKLLRVILKLVLALVFRLPVEVCFRLWGLMISSSQTFYTKQGPTLIPISISIYLSTYT